jgi:hypothetical protein
MIFRVARAIQRALGDLHKGVPMPKSDAMTKDEFLKVVGLDYWQEVENRFKP